MSYEAVIGYTEDSEAATWASGFDARSAIEDAARSFHHEWSDEIETNGVYEATVYRDPVNKTDEETGDEHVVGWADRGVCDVTFGCDYSVSVREIRWDGKPGPEKPVEEKS